MNYMHDYAVWLASVFGPFLTIIGVWMLVYTDNLMQTYHSLKSAPALVYLRSVFNLVLGLFIIAQFNVWEKDASLMVTLLGWGFFSRGAVTLFAPQFAMKMGLSDQKILQVRGIIPLIWGLLLLWYAFWR